MSGVWEQEEPGVSLQRSTVQGAGETQEQERSRAETWGPHDVRGQGRKTVKTCVLEGWVGRWQKVTRALDSSSFG